MIKVKPKSRRLVFFLTLDPQMYPNTAYYTPLLLDRTGQGSKGGHVQRLQTTPTEHVSETVM